MEFNLQSAVVETFEETEDHQSDAGFRPRRKHVFRLVAHKKSLTRMSPGESQGGDANGGGGSGVEESEDTAHGGGRGNLPGGTVDLPVVDESPTRRKVWVLAAMSEQVRYVSARLKTFEIYTWYVLYGCISFKVQKQKKRTTPTERTVCMQATKGKKTKDDVDWKNKNKIFCLVRVPRVSGYRSSL